jgi:hypothetical protein
MCARALRLWDFAFALPGLVPGKLGFVKITSPSPRLGSEKAGPRAMRMRRRECGKTSKATHNRFKREEKASHGFLTEKVFCCPGSMGISLPKMAWKVSDE